MLVLRRAAGREPERRMPPKWAGAGRKGLRPETRRMPGPSVQWEERCCVERERRGGLGNGGFRKQVSTCTAGPRPRAMPAPSGPQGQGSVVAEEHACKTGVARGSRFLRRRRSAAARTLPASRSSVRVPAARRRPEPRPTMIPTPRPPRQVRAEMRWTAAGATRSEQAPEWTRTGRQWPRGAERARRPVRKRPRGRA